jgi:hypothetical protein
MHKRLLPDQDALSGLIDEIVAELPSDEHRKYARAKRHVFERVYISDDPASLFETPSSVFEFGAAETIEIVKSVGILLGTIKTAIDLTSLLRKAKASSGDEERLKSLKAEWRQELVNAGIASDQAAEITERFSVRFLDVIA